MLETRFRTRFCSVCFKSELNYEGVKDPQPEPQERHQKYCKVWKKKNSTCQKKKINSYKIEELN